MPFTRLCPQCSAPVKIKIGECVCGHSFRKRRSIATKDSKWIEMKCKIEFRVVRDCHRISRDVITLDGNPRQLSTVITRVKIILCIIF